MPAPPERSTAKLFMHSRSQAVRLPKEFRFEGTEVRVRRNGDQVILEPLEKAPTDLSRFWAELDALGPSLEPSTPTAAPDADAPELQERMICLDSNVVISILNMRNEKLRQRLGDALHAGTPIALPVVALHELRYGFTKSPQGEVEEQRLEKFFSLGIATLPFEADDALHAAEIRAEMHVNSVAMDPYDALVAAQAIRHGAILATLNKNGFARVRELNVLDWSE